MELLDKLIRLAKEGENLAQEARELYSMQPRATEYEIRAYTWRVETWQLKLREFRKEAEMRRELHDMVVDLTPEQYERMKEEFIQKVQHRPKLRVVE